MLQRKKYFSTCPIKIVKLLRFVELVHKFNLITLIFSYNKKKKKEL